MKTASIHVPASEKYGLNSSEKWKIYEFPHHCGLFLIKNLFTAAGHRLWTVKCLRDYPKQPHKTNLGKINQGRDDFWADLQNEIDPARFLKLRNSLRWVTLGFHHDWDTKVYSESNQNEFPIELADMIDSLIAPGLGFNLFKSQAAIVNYYPPGSTLSGHTDHSEQDLSAPLFSISFGQSAIFLIGGREKTDFTSPVLLESGDCLVMTKESRLSYHAVPRILSGSPQRWNDGIPECDLLDEDWKPFNGYLRDCRININVRQVLPYNQTTLCSS